MGERMFASEGDSMHVGHPPSSWEDRWNHSPPRDAPVGDDAVAGVLRRLQSRVDRHHRLLERMQSDPLQPEPAGLPELLHTARGMRRDTESLLILHGRNPDVAPGARQLSDVLAGAAAAAEEPHRVDVRTVPPATVSPAGATELLHVLAEVVDHVTAVYPGARVDVSCRTEVPGGVAVEVRADGAGRHDPEGLGGHRALAAAQRLAQRSRSGIALHTPAPGGTASGPVASIHCPGSVVSVEPVAADPGVEPAGVDPGVGPERALTAWSRQRRRSAADAPAPDPLDLDPLFSGPLPLERLLAEPTRLEPTYPASARVNGNGHGDNGHGGNGNGNGGSARTSAPAYVPSAGSGVDELFGPMLDLLHDPADQATTPIFEAIASAWFREDEATGGAPDGSGRHGAGTPHNWETPSDTEWRAAAERAARPEPEARTPTGLPRRRPGNQLVPPPRGGRGVDEPQQPERVPDRVRDRLSTYQRGLRQGRHRAEPTADPDDPAAW